MWQKSRRMTGKRHSAALDDGKMMSKKRGPFSCDRHQDDDVRSFRKNGDHRYDLMNEINQGVEIYNEHPGK